MRAKRNLHWPIALLLFAWIWVGTEWVSAAVTTAAEDYAVRLSHRVVAQSSASRGLELELTVLNGGSQDLYDLRIFLIRAGGLGVSDTRTPARVRSLPAGGLATFEWTFENARGPRLAAGTTGPLVFHIEAVDKSTQQLVAFTRGSVEGR